MAVSPELPEPPELLDPPELPDVPDELVAAAVAPWVGAAPCPFPEPLVPPLVTPPELLPAAPFVGVGDPPTEPPVCPEPEFTSLVDCAPALPAPAPGVFPTVGLPTDAPVEVATEPPPTAGVTVAGEPHAATRPPIANASPAVQITRRNLSFKVSSPG